MNKQAAEGLYEKLVESAGDIIGVLDQQGTIAFVNSRIEHYPGFTAIETIGKHYTELVHPDDWARFGEVLEQAFAGTPIVDLPFSVVMPGGGISHWVANGEVVDLEDTRFLMAICRDVSESVNLRNELLNRNRALAALGKVAVALSSCGDLNEGLSEALHQILSALCLTYGAIVLKEADGEVRIGASSVRDVAVLSARAAAAGKLVSLECMERGEPIVVPDLFDDSVDPLVQELSRALGIEAFVAIPLLSKGSVRASLALGVPPPADLSEDQKDFLQSAAGILGPAVENAALHADLTDRVDRLAMLERLARSINSERDVPTVLQSCMREIARLIRFDMAVVVLFRPGLGAEVFPFSRGGECQPVSSVGLNQDHVNRISQVSSPMVISGDTIGAYHTRPEMFDMAGGSAGVVPLVRMGEKFGLLKVWSREPDRYGPRELEILAAAAEHLSIAASNAAMYEREQQRSLELAALATEVRHRIKNNLQMISGLLEMSRSCPESGARTVARCLRQVRAISTIHDLLSPDDISASMSLKDCLVRIAANSVQATGRADSISLSVEGDDCKITSDAATAVGVMVNELVSNAVEHGFAEMHRGRLMINTTCKNDGSFSIEVIDNGAGLPVDFNGPEPGSSATGLGLVSSLAAYGLGGKLELERRQSGVCARISVKGARSGISGIGS